MVADNVHFASSPCENNNFTITVLVGQEDLTRIYSKTLVTVTPLCSVSRFSRRVLWLNVNKSNNNPKIVAGYFMTYLNEIQGVPRCVRTDKGTENVMIANIQKAFRWDHPDNMCGENSFLTGSSPSNQRIERWWRSAKEGGLQYWIDFFKDKESEGIISTNNPSQLFCFTKLIQSDLNQCRHEWNQLKVRTSRNAAVSGGKPDIMFFSPELYEQCEFPGENGCDREIERQCVEFCLRNRQEMPQNANEAIDLFQILIMNLDV